MGDHCLSCNCYYCIATTFDDNYLSTREWDSAFSDLLDGGNEITNADVRKYLYRMVFIKTNFERLIANVRIELPGCVTRLIRKRYPSNAYTRYHNAVHQSTAALDIRGNKIPNLFWVKKGDRWTLEDADGNHAEPVVYLDYNSKR